MADWSSHAFTARGTIVPRQRLAVDAFRRHLRPGRPADHPDPALRAARVDGAGAWRQFWHITVPGLRSVLIVVILLRGIWMFNKFDLILAAGDQGRAAEPDRDIADAGPIGKRFWSSNLRHGGAAVATISFLILASVILVYLRLFPIDETQSRGGRRRQTMWSERSVRPSSSPGASKAAPAPWKGEAGNPTSRSLRRPASMRRLSRYWSIRSSRYTG